MDSIRSEMQRVHALRAITCAFARLKWLAAARRFEIAMERHMLALKYGVKAGYKPAQPRVPKSNPGGGRWTATGSGKTGPVDNSSTNSAPTNPKGGPPNKKLRKVLRELARRLGPYVGTAIQFGTWVYDNKDEIVSYFDPPKPLADLQEAATEPKEGYDVHHIVERNSAAGDGSEDDLVEGRENKVAIPRWKHWEINRWYETENSDFGGQTPRQYLRGKSWEERTRVGLMALKSVGVLRR